MFVDSCTAYPGFPNDILAHQADSSMRVGEMSRTTTVKVSTQRNNGVVDLMALPKGAGEDVCIALAR